MCEKCQDRGFTEENHGLIRVFCDCEKGEELKVEITGIAPRYYTEAEVKDDIASGAEPDDNITGSDNPSQPKQSSKPKKKKRARKRSS